MASKSPRIILLSGTPGTGKTSVAQELFSQFQYRFISAGQVVLEENLYGAEDVARDTKVVDNDNTFFAHKLETLSEDLIFECHYADMLDHPQISLGIILRCHPTVLETRLKSRGYSDQKLRENGEAELLGASSSYMLEKQDLVKGNTLFEIDTTHISILDIANCIHEIIQHPSQHQELKVGKISWLSDETIDLTRYTRTN
jgi:adenylate kinase